MSDINEKGWYAKLTLEIKGPKEGPVTVSVEYVDTIRKVAVGLQNKLAELGLQLNKVGF